MKKLILNIGQEAVVGVIYEAAGKTKSLRRVFEIPCIDYYNNMGRLDIMRIVSSVKKAMPRDVRSLDIDLILPTYVTDVEYVDAIEDQYDDHDEKNEKNKKKGLQNRVEKTVFIGESQTRRVNQKIVFNIKELNAIVTAFHKENLNVVRALSNASCYHNFMAAFNATDAYGADFKAHICMVWGISKISYIIMLGNLPVEMYSSNYKLTDSYQDLAAMGCNLPLSQVIKVMNSFYLTPDPDAGLILEHSSNMITDGSRTIELADAEIALIENVFYSFVTGLVDEVRNVADYVRNKYTTGNINICTNSKLLDECLCKSISESYPIEYLNVKEKIEIYNDRFTLKSIPDLNDKYVPILGCVVDGIKKGSDFYDA